MNKSQIELQGNEHRLRYLLDKSPNGLFVIDSDGRVVEWNEALAQITGIPAKDTIGQYLWDIQYQLLISNQSSPDLYADLQEQIQAVVNKGETSWLEKKIVQEIITKQNEIKTIEWICYPIHENNRISIIGVIRDITLEKSSELKIIRQQRFSQKLAKITEQLNDQLELPIVLEIICCEIAQELSVDGVQVLLYEPEKDILAIANTYGSIDLGEVIQTPFPKKFYDAYFAHGESYLVIPNVPGTLSQHPYYGFLIKTNIRSAAVFNMTRDETLIGTLVLATIGDRRSYDEEELTFAATLANHAAIAIDRARIYQQTKQRTQELEILESLSAKLRSANTQQEILPILLKQTVVTTQATAGVIYLLGQAGNPVDSFYYPAPNGSNTDWVTPNSALWARALSSDDLILDPIPDDHPGPGGEPYPQKKTIRFRIFIPLQSTKILTAIMILGFQSQHAPDGAERRFLSSLAEMGGNALHRSGLVEMLEKRVTDRTRELTALYDLTLFVNSPMGLSDLLNEALRKVIDANHATSGLIYRYEPVTSVLAIESHINLPVQLAKTMSSIKLPGEMIQWLVSSHSPWLAYKEESVSIPTHMPGIGVYETVINVPIRFEGIPYGLLTVLWLDRYDPTVESIAFLSAVAERLGSAIQNDLLRQKSEQTAVLEERQRLARELHDSVTQSVYSLTLLAEASQDLLTRGDFLRLKKCLSELGENSIQALKEMRMLLFELRPPQQGEQGLAKALQIRLEAVEQRAGVKAIFEVIETISLVPEIQEELYRVAIEALNNSLKHSGASSVLVKLRILDIGVQMAIEDNGKGFNPAADRSGGMGLNTMKERVSRLGGTLDIRSNPGQGTQVLVSLEK